MVRYGLPAEACLDSLVVVPGDVFIDCSGKFLGCFPFVAVVHLDFHSAEESFASSIVRRTALA